MNGLCALGSLIRIISILASFYSLFPFFFAGERELIEFLSEEIATETKNRKVKSLPTDVEGFKVSTDGADVVLTKTTGDETQVIAKLKCKLFKKLMHFLTIHQSYAFRIEIHFNINHTVDNETEPSVDPTMDKADFGELKSKPTFDVDIKRGTTTLSFTCSFFETQPEQTEEGYSKFKCWVFDLK